MNSFNKNLQKELRDNFLKEVQKRNLIKEESITKQASKEKQEFVVSTKETFDTMFLKLTARLHSLGLMKEANALEEKYLLLKEAEVHLYHCKEENALDYVNLAHPKGGEQLMGSPESKVETTIEQQAKILKELGKKPTRKISK